MIRMFAFLAVAFSSVAHLFGAEPEVRRHLYVASPGIRNYVEFGGHGVLVFDIDNHHKFVRRISGVVNASRESKSSAE